MSGARRGKGDGLTFWLALTALAAPVLVVGAGAATQTGLIDVGIGRELLADRVAPVLALGGLVGSIAAVWRARGTFRRDGLIVTAALIVAVATLAAFGLNLLRAQNIAPGVDVTSAPDDPPAFGRQIMAQRGEVSVSDRFGTCPGVEPVMSQLRPDQVVAALTTAGFTPLGAAAFRADGTHEGMWFGVDHDAAVRIRPGRTDLRVAQRTSRPDDGQTCRLAVKLSQALQTAD